MLSNQRMTVESKNVTQVRSTMSSTPAKDRRRAEGAVQLVDPRKVQFPVEAPSEARHRMI